MHVNKTDRTEWNGARKVVRIREIAAELARLNGIDQAEMDKIVSALEKYILQQLERYGEADFLGAGRLVVSDYPDVHIEYIPYPVEVTELKYRIALQKAFGGNEGAIGKGTGKDRN